MVDMASVVKPSNYTVRVKTGGILVSCRPCARVYVYAMGEKLFKSRRLSVIEKSFVFQRLCSVAVRQWCWSHCHLDPTELLASAGFKVMIRQAYLEILISSFLSHGILLLIYAYLTYLKAESSLTDTRFPPIDCSFQEWATTGALHFVF